MLLQLIDVPHWCLINMLLHIGFSQCLQVWFSCSRGWKWIVHRTITVMSCCSNGSCQTSVKLLATLAFQRITRAQEHWAAVTRLRTSHQTWPPNRPDLSSVNSVDYRLLRILQECLFQKQQGMSNIVDELWLLTG